LKRQFCGPAVVFPGPEGQPQTPAQLLRRFAEGVGEIGFKEIIDTGCFEVPEGAPKQRGQILELPPERTGAGQKSRVRLVKKENNRLGSFRITDEEGNKIPGLKYLLAHEIH
jgi:hypothetical protein